MSCEDAAFMAIALRLARRGLGRTWPNPAVGAVVVACRNGAEIVGRGWTQPGGRPHAEVVALRRAGEDARGATLYVTLEPCAHHGKSPPCVDTIIASGVGRVVCATGDPDRRVGGQGFARLREAGIEVVPNVLQAEGRIVAAGHVRRITEQRPLVQLKLAVGSDGRIAAGDGAPVWVTGEAARAHAHLLRARADAIMVGSGTVEADDPSLTCRLPGLRDRSPVRIVLDSRLRTPATAKLLSGLDSAPTWLACAADAPAPRRAALQAAGADVLEVPRGPDGRLRLRDVLGRLAERGITRLLVEGGPRVARGFLDADLVDEAVLYVAPAPVGPGGLLPFVTDGLERLLESKRFIRVEQRYVGPDRRCVLRRGR